jgi:hypothetical protein
MAKLDKNPRPKLTLFPRLVSRRGRCKTDPGGEDAFAAPRHSAGLATISPWPCASLAWGQMTGTLSYVAHSFGENWRMGLAALLDRPAALFYIVGVVAVLALTFSGFRVGSRVGYRRGQFLSANEEMFLRTLDAALGGNYRAFAQVRLVEIANPADSANVRLRAGPSTQ